MAYSNIKDPSAYFQALTYTGNGTTTNNVTNTGNSNLQPDFVWIKDRSVARDHVVTDSSRDGGVASGTNLVLTPNTAEAEASSTGFGINYATNGINFDAAWNKVNGSGETYVAWQWKANAGTTASNTDGNITSTVQVNQDAGFSIVTYTGNGSNNQTIGHGLGVQPSWWVVKNRSGGSTNWLFGASSILGGTSNYLKLNDNSANTEYNNIWGDSPTSSTLFRVSNLSHLNTNGSNYVAYLFSDKQGYSRFGKYTGNGSADGTFVYTGFRPAFLMMKRIDSTGNWVMFDTKRDLGNVTKTRLFPNLTNADNTTRNYVDLLSNGFKLRDTDVDHNASGSTIIYMAFAEHPFVADGVPTTAR